MRPQGAGFQASGTVGPATQLHGLAGFLEVVEERRHLADGPEVRLGQGDPVSAVPDVGDVKDGAGDVEDLPGPEAVLRQELDGQYGRAAFERVP